MKYWVANISVPRKRAKCIVCRRFAFLRAIYAKVPIHVQFRPNTIVVCMPVSLGGNVHRILLQNEPIFRKFQENTHSEGKQIWIFSSLLIFSVLGRWYFRDTIRILSTLYKWIGIKHCK